MNTSKLAELFLTSRYGLAESEGHTKLFYLNDFATKIFPEFLAWHALLERLFGIKPPEWIEKKSAQGTLLDGLEEEDEDDEDEK